MVFQRGLDRRPAGGAADGREGRGLHRRARRRARVSRMPGAAAPWRSHARGARDQHGDGRVQARLRAGGARRNAGADRQRLQPQRRAGDDAHGGAAARRQRAGRARDRHEWRGQRVRLGQPRQCDDRPSDPAHSAERRRRHAGRPRQIDPRPSRQIHLLRRRERGGEPVRALPCREGVRGRGFDRLRHRRRTAAQRAPTMSPTTPRASSTPSARR